MANATAITLNDFVPGAAGLANPTAQVLDTGTAAVTISTVDTVGAHDRIVVRVENTAAANLTVTQEAADAAGENPPSLRGSLGDLTSGNIAQNATRWFGPFDPARFTKAGGVLTLTFTPASGTITGNFTAYRLPKSA